MLILSSKFFNGSPLPGSVLHHLVPITANIGNSTEYWGKLTRVLVAGRGCFRRSSVPGPTWLLQVKKHHYIGKLWHPGQNEKFLLWLSTHSTIWLPNWLSTFFFYYFPERLFCFSYLFILHKIITLPKVSEAFASAFLFEWRSPLFIPHTHSPKPWPSIATPTHSSPKPFFFFFFFTMEEKVIMILRSLLGIWEVLLQDVGFEQGLEGWLGIERQLKGRWEGLFRWRGLNEKYLMHLEKTLKDFDWVGLHQDRKFVFLESSSSDSHV